MQNIVILSAINIDYYISTTLWTFWVFLIMNFQKFAKIWHHLLSHKIGRLTIIYLRQFGRLETCRNMRFVCVCNLKVCVKLRSFHNSLTAQPFRAVTSDIGENQVVGRGIPLEVWQNWNLPPIIGQIEKNHRTNWVQCTAEASLWLHFNVLLESPGFCF